MAPAFIQDEAPGVVATPARLTAWAEAAGAGERFVYATRFALPPGSVGAACARKLEAQGLIHLVRQRVTDAAVGWNYIAERSSSPWPAAQPARRRLSPREPDVVAEVEQLAVDQLFPILSRAAQFARPCPTDKQMAARIGASAEQVHEAMGALRTLQLVVVHPAPPPTNRFVTIVTTGWRTGLAA